MVESMGRGWVGAEEQSSRKRGLSGSKPWTTDAAQGLLPGQKAPAHCLGEEEGSTGSLGLQRHCPLAP